MTGGFNIFITIILLLCNCKPSKVEVEKNINILKTEIDTSCIRFSNANWEDIIDDIDAGGEFVGTYNGLILKAYLVNTCNDTIYVAYDRNGIQLGFVNWYLKNDSLTSISRVEEKPELYYNVAPGDSIYVNVIDGNEYSISNLDHATVWTIYKQNDVRYEKLVSIDLKKAKLNKN